MSNIMIESKKWAEYLLRKFKTKVGCGVLISISANPEEPCLEFLMDAEFEKQYTTNILQVNFSEIDSYDIEPVEAGSTNLSEAEKFFLKLGDGGKIISSGDCSDIEIAQAQESDRFYVAQNMLGFVYFPAQPKRKPLPDGRLELTREELMELRWMVNINIDEVVFKMDKLWIIPCGQLENVKAILYLATLFDLNMETKSE